MATRRAAKKAKPQVDDFRHPTETRKNNPPAKIAAEGTVPAVPKATYSYSPRRPPQLQFDPDGEYAALLRKARRQPRSDEEAARLEQALAAREPWLEWAEKREQHARGGFAVDPVALHIHERVSTQAILKVAQRQDVQKTLFADPEHEYHQAVQFYRYDIDWTNRLILGDSLQVMSSLAHRENLAGKVQMIYIDPGDLVLDPTCGSGTTAYVAEQWGRRWITIDTSRVAVAIARQRLLTAKFDMYRVKEQSGESREQSFSPGGASAFSRGREPTEAVATEHASPGGATESAPRAAAPPGLHETATPDHRGLTPTATRSGPSGAAHLGVDPHPGFVYKTVPHITLKSIAQNQNLDPIFAKWEPVLDDKLAACNAALADVTKDIRDTLELKLLDKQRAEGARSITDADRRRWQLPDCHTNPKRQRGTAATPAASATQPLADASGYEHWTVPFDTDPDWPKSLQTAVTEYRTAWRGKMDAVNACIAANADQEDLVDQPEPIKGVVRVSGPFTVEAVQPPELSLGDAVGLFEGAPGMIEETFEVRPVEVFHETQNVTGYLDNMLRLMRIDGVRFPDNKQMQFTSLDPIYTHSGGSTLHAEGNWTPASGGREATEPASDARSTVAVVIGPQYGPITTKQVVEAIPIAFRRGYTDLVFAGFSFVAGAYAEVENQANPKIKLHLATIRPDVNPGMEGLLKEQPGSQLFTVFGQPRVTLTGPDKRGEYTVTMEGVDIYDPVNNVVQPTRADKVAAWFLDSDYDGRTFCITQAFFPDRGAWDKLERALNGKDGLIDEDKFAAFSGTASLPFKPEKEGRVAVKVIDPRGNEVLWVREVG